MKKLKTVFCIILMVMVAGGAYAGVTPEEAARLKKDLMPLGGEKAGNKDGTIPAWDGGYTIVPSGYKSGDRRPDPFADEKPLFTITAANKDQYADKLDEATLLMLKKYPDTYRLNVYPTHRTMAAQPWIYEETFKNATRASLDGYEVKNAFGGPPFPIPKDGEEVLWNHEMRIRPAAMDYPFSSWIIDDTGTPAMASKSFNEFNNLLYNPKNSYQSLKDQAGGLYFQAVQATVGPPFRAGEFLIFLFSYDNTNKGYQYLVGQRRMRKAPTMCCDTPNIVNSGVDFFDQPFVFLGEFIRYDFKIIKKREMYVPYNCNKLALTPTLEAVDKHHVKPEYVRWELHRVWEIEGNIREGYRDSRPRRKLYIDEDGWMAVIGNTWDAQGNLWHQGLGFPTMLYEVPCTVSELFLTTDFLRDQWTFTTYADEDIHIKSVEPKSPDYYGPANVLQRVVR